MLVFPGQCLRKSDSGQCLFLQSLFAFNDTVGVQVAPEQMALLLPVVGGDTDLFWSCTVLLFFRLKEGPTAVSTLFMTLTIDLPPLPKLLI